jgi:signal transduction histidine kinase
MSRVFSIGQTVTAIIHGDLKHRLPTQSSDDELNTLSRTINGMLEQIELLVHGVRNVSNSIAHDLRTPLAELRSRLEELALMRPPPETTFAEIDGAVADVDRVIRIFDALLRLAEIDAGMRRSGFVRSISRTSRRTRSSSMRRPRSSRTSSSPFTRPAAAGVGRSGAARAGAQQSDRQRAQICAR